jgi:hypothetical protein
MRLCPRISLRQLSTRMVCCSVRLHTWLFRICLFDVKVRELHETLYQYDIEYLFDSTKFEKAFNFEATTCAQGIQVVAEAYQTSLV